MRCAAASSMAWVVASLAAASSETVIRPAVGLPFKGSKLLPRSACLPSAASAVVALELQ